MIHFIHLYHLYSSIIFRVARLLAFSFLGALLVSQFQNGKLSFPIVFLFSFFATLELFFLLKIGKIKPFVSVQRDSELMPFNSFTKEALDAYVSSYGMPGIIKKLLHFPQVRFILEKSVILQKELVIQALQKDALYQNAKEIAKEVGGLFVTSMDVLIAYLLLSEEQTKLLFSKKIKKEELLQILILARKQFPLEENPPPFRVKFWGAGIGEGLVTGWTLETKKYTVDITSQLSWQKPIVVGRDTEYKVMVEALSQNENNNVVLVGESGSGKDALVELLAYESLSLKINGNLNNKRVLELMLGPLVSGSSNSNDLETRLQSIIDEVTHSKNIILFIPQFQIVIGQSPTNLNIPAILLPYLKNGKIPLIATMTMGNYKELLEQNPILDVFQVIKLEVPNPDIALAMISQKALVLEDEQKVIISYKAIKASVEFANRYLPTSVLPGSAVKLLQDAISEVLIIASPYFDHTKKRIVTDDFIIKKVEEKTKIALSFPSDIEKEVLLHLEDKLHERIIGQTEAVTAIAEAMRRLRTGMTSQNKPLSFLFLGPTGVGKTETAKALASLYFKGEDKMIRLDMSEYTTDDGVKRLLGAPPGEGTEKGELTEKMYEHPFSLVLLDEFEKANSKIHDLFLQVLDDGRLTDNKGKTVSFINSIIIATSNATSEYIRQEILKGTSIDKQFQHQLLDLLQSKGLFKPELLNRFDAIIVFKPLGKDEVMQITKHLLKNVERVLLEKDITITFDEKVIEKIANEAFNEEFGARPIKRYIQDNIEDLLSEKMLKDELQRGNTVLITTDANHTILMVEG